MTALLENAASPMAAELEIATFRVGDALMGIAIEHVEEINHHLELTPVPHAPPCVRGLMNLRGEVVTVIDLRVVLGLEPTAVTRQTCNVVVGWCGEHFGIIVDRVGDVLRARREDIEPPPANISAADGRLLSGVCKLENDILAILDVEQVLSLDPRTK